MNSDAVSMAALLTSLTIFSVLGNGFVLGILVRFKELRTYPNIMTANLSLVDLLNALINMPIFLLSAVLKISWFKGKILAIISSFLSRLIVLLNVSSMTLLQVNVFVALTFDLRFFTWKTKEKAVAIVLIEWLICLVLASLASVPLFDVDLQDAPVYKYRRQFYTQDRYFLAPFMGLFVVAAIVFGALVVHSVEKKKLERQRLNLPQLQTEARLKMDIQAAITVAMTVFAFLVCYIPPIVFAAWGLPEPNANDVWWPGFLAQFSIFISSGINPIIYCFRARRFRSALKQLLKDPCGRSPFQEPKPKPMRMIQRNIPGKITSPAAVSNKVTGRDLEEARIAHGATHVTLEQRATCPTAGPEERGVLARHCEEETNVNTCQICPGGLVRMESYHTLPNSAGARSHEERPQLSPTPSEHHVKQEVTVEMHPDRNDCLQKTNSQGRAKIISDKNHPQRHSCRF